MTKQARRFAEWRIRRYNGKICPICRFSAGVDYWQFQGLLGGNGHNLITYLCMICQGYVVKATQARRPNANDTTQRDWLQRPIARDFLITEG